MNTAPINASSVASNSEEQINLNGLSVSWIPPHLPIPSSTVFTHPTSHATSNVPSDPIRPPPPPNGLLPEHGMRTVPGNLLYSHALQPTHTNISQQLPDSNQREHAPVFNLNGPIQNVKDLSGVGGNVISKSRNQSEDRSIPGILTGQQENISANTPDDRGADDDRVWMTSKHLSSQIVP